MNALMQKFSHQVLSMFLHRTIQAQNHIERLWAKNFQISNRINNSQLLKLHCTTRNQMFPLNRLSVNPLISSSNHKFNLGTQLLRTWKYWRQFKEWGWEITKEDFRCPKLKLILQICIHRSKPNTRRTNLSLITSTLALLHKIIVQIERDQLFKIIMPQLESNHRWSLRPPQLICLTILNQKQILLINGLLEE